MKYPMLRLYFRGTETIIDIPNAFGLNIKALGEMVSSNDFAPRIIKGQDARGNPIIASLEDYLDDIAFAAAIMVDDGKDAEHDRTLDRLNQNPN